MEFDREMAHEKCAKLIQLVEKYPWIYDTSRKDYHDGAKKQKTYIEIGNAVDWSAAAVDKKWKYLREKFAKEFRKERKPSDTDGAPAKKRRSSWVHYPNMMWLKPCIRQRVEITSLNSDSVAQPTEEETIAEAPTDPFAETMTDPLAEAPTDPLAAALADSLAETPTNVLAAALTGDPLAQQVRIAKSPASSAVIGGTSTSRQAAATAGPSNLRVTCNEVEPKPRENLDIRMVEALTKDPDPDKCFLMAMLPRVRDLTPRNKAQFQLKMLQCLTDLEDG